MLESARIRDNVVQIGKGVELSCRRGECWSKTTGRQAPTNQECGGREPRRCRIGGREPDDCGWVDRGEEEGTRGAVGLQSARRKFMRSGAPRANHNVGYKLPRYQRIRERARPPRDEGGGLPSLKIAQWCASNVSGPRGSEGSPEEVAPSRAKPIIHTVATPFSVGKAMQRPVQESNIYI